MASPSQHSLVQFLNSLLSQRGPNALPYREDVKRLIRQHLVNLIEDFPSLSVKPAAFVHNDGSSIHLLQAEGTVPMSYQGITYNIPVIIWLMGAYPKGAPRVFVTPTRDMVVKQPHRHVNASGVVTIPYLQNWVYPRSNLLELVRSLGLMFGQDPPLYSKPNAAPQRSPNLQRANVVQAGGSQATHPSPTASQSRPTSSRPHHPQTQLPPSPQQSSRAENPPPQPYNHTENPSEVFKRNAINTLVERLKKDTFQVCKTQEADMDKLMTTQAQLKQREDHLKQGIQDMQKEKEGLEEQLQVVLTNTDVLESWLRINDKPDLKFEIDDVFEPCDVLSKQLLDCTSADLAVEDILYSLDKAVQEGSISVDVYLKHVRHLAREQFFHRAIAVKIRDVQLQTQVDQMAARYVS